MLRIRSLTLTGLVPVLLAACSNAPEQPAESNVPKVQSASVVPPAEPVEAVETAETPEIIGTGETAPSGAPEPELTDLEAAEDDVMRFASLAPSGSFLWLQVSSLDDLIEVGNQFAFWGGEGMDLEQGLKLFPVPGVVEHIDRSLPIGIAVGFAEGSQEPGATLVLPVTNRGQVIQAFRSAPDDLEVFGIDEYVVASTLPEYVPGSGESELVSNLPEGQIVARIDVPELIDGLGPMVTMGLAQMKQQADLPVDAGGPANEIEREMRLAVIEGMEKAIRSAASLDLVLSQEGDDIDVSLSFVADEGSELDGLLPAGSGNLRGLARCIDADADFGLLVSVDSETLSQTVLPLWTSALESSSGGAEPMPAPVREWLENFAGLWPLCGDSVVARAETDDSGLCLAYYFLPGDHDAFLQELTSLFSTFSETAPGLQIAGPAELPGEKSFVLSVAEPAEGINLADLSRREEELERVFGTSEVLIRVAQHKGTTVLTVGGGERYLGDSRARLDRAPEEVAPSVAAGLEALGDANPAFVMHLDLVGFMSDFSSLLAEEAGTDSFEGWESVVGEAPLPIVYYGGVDGLQWKVGVRADLARLGEVMQKAGR